MNKVVTFIMWVVIVLAGYMLIDFISAHSDYKPNNTGWGIVKDNPLKK